MNVHEAKLQAIKNKKSRQDTPANAIEHKKLTDTLLELKTAVDELKTSVKDQPELDTSELESNISHLQKTIAGFEIKQENVDLKPIVEQIKQIKNVVNVPELKTEGLADKESINVLNESITKVVDRLVSLENSIKPGQEPYNYLPIRRVVYRGNKLEFDDSSWGGSYGGGGGVSGGSSSGGDASAANQTSGDQKTQIVDAGGEVATVTGGKLDVNATASLAGTALPIASAADAVGVAIVDGSGNQITSFGGGTQYTEGDTDASITGTAMMVEDGSNTLQPAQGDKTNGLDVDVTRSALPTGAATSANQLPNNHDVVVTSAPTTAVTGTFWQATQPVSGTVTETNSAAIKTAVETIDNAIAGSEMQVDVVGSLPAGTNAIGKLSANSGVDIGDVDITSAVSATMDHGSNQDIDTTAEQITSTSFACKFGVTLKADITNTGIIYVGNSDVTAGGTAATDGFPLSAGETLTLEVTNSNIPYAIASANNQKIFWVAV